MTMKAGVLTPALVVATFGLMSACNSAAEDTPGAVKHPAEAPTPNSSPLLHPKEAKPCLLPEYNLKMVEADAKTAQQAKLSTTVVAKMVRQNPRLPPLFKDYNEYWQLYALDTVRCKEFSIVSYLYRHEDCCSDIYYVTFSPDGKKVIDWVNIADTGADGMWGATATMSTRQTRLRVTELTRDSEDDGQPGFQDSVVTDYSVTPHGKFARTRIDSVRIKLVNRN